MKALQEAVTQLQVLLEEPHPELTTWSVAVDAQIEKIARLWGRFELDNGLSTAHYPV